MTRQQEIKTLIEEGYKRGVFPLQTPSSLAKRWNTTTAAVQMKALRDKNFPQPLDGIIAKMEKGGRVYSLCDIENYERNKGMNV